MKEKLLLLVLASIFALTGCQSKDVLDAAKLSEAKETVKSDKADGNNKSEEQLEVKFLKSVIIGEDYWPKYYWDESIPIIGFEINSDGTIEIAQDYDNDVAQALAEVESIDDFANTDTTYIMDYTAEDGKILPVGNDVLFIWSDLNSDEYNLATMFYGCDGAKSVSLDAFSELPLFEYNGVKYVAEDQAGYYVIEDGKADYQYGDGGERLTAAMQNFADLEYICSFQYRYFINGCIYDYDMYRYGDGVILANNLLATQIPESENIDTFFAVECYADASAQVESTIDSAESIYTYDIEAATLLYRLHDDDSVPLELTREYLENLAAEEYTISLDIKSIEYAPDQAMEDFIVLYSDDVGFETALTDFTVVKAEYTAEYDHTLTPLEDGDKAWLFYFKKNSNGEWELWSSGFNKCDESGIMPSSVVYTYLKANGADSVEKIELPANIYDDDAGSFDLTAQYTSGGEALTADFTLEKTGNAWKIASLSFGGIDSLS